VRRFFVSWFATFFARTCPASNIAKPACMKKIRKQTHRDPHQVHALREDARVDAREYAGRHARVTPSERSSDRQRVSSVFMF